MRRKLDGLEKAKPGMVIRRHSRGPSDVLFVTGTDTGVGKTVLTALLLEHLRAEQRRSALAIKPFCSGGREDARLLRSLQPELSLDEVNPFHFRPALAPGIVLAAQKQDVSLQSVLKWIQAIRRRCDTLLIEGAGGIMVPLGQKFLVADLVAELGCKTIVVGRNRLGTINHTLLTTKYLENIGITVGAVALMGERVADESVGSNVSYISKELSGTAVFGLPYLGKDVSEKRRIKECAGGLKKELARIVSAGSVKNVLSKGERKD